MKSKLGSYDVNVSPESTRSHLIFRVEVPENTEELRVQYSFSPEVEKDVSRIDDLFEQYKEVNNMADCDRNKIDSVRNLITVSASSARGYEGSCHRFLPKGMISINQQKSTPGMLTHSVVPGFWNISFNFHALVTEETMLHCTIEAIHSKQGVHTPVYMKQLTKQQIDRPEIENTIPYKVELHTHTEHSDAIHTEMELIEEAKRNGVDWLAITDHNTLSVFDGQHLGDDLLHVIKGLEMTTFYGHFLTLGYKEQPPVDWTTIDRYNIRNKLKEMKAQGLMIGIAHPFDVGTPYCTGCRWEYVLDHLDEIDFLEVWNSEDPHKSSSNDAAFKRWTELLNQGIEIPATCGRDWHHSNTTKTPAYMYVLAQENAQQDDILQAVRLGRSYLTLGPKLQLCINEKWTFGDKLFVNEYDTLTIQFEMLGVDEPSVVKLESNLGTIFHTTETSFVHLLEEKYYEDIRWLRATVYDQENYVQAFTNPIYFA